MNNLTQNEKFLLSLLNDNNLSIQEWISLPHSKRIKIARKIKIERKIKYNLATEWFIIACKLGLVTQQHFNELVRTSQYKYVKLLCRYTDLNPNIYYNGESPMLIASYFPTYDMLKILMRRCGGDPGPGGLIPEQKDTQHMLPELVPYDIGEQDLEDFFESEMEKQKQDQSKVKQVFYKSPLLDPLQRYMESGSTKQRLQHTQRFNSLKRTKKHTRKHTRKRSQVRKRSKPNTRKRSKSNTRKRSKQTKKVSIHRAARKRSHVRKRSKSIVRKRSKQTKKASRHRASRKRSREHKRSKSIVRKSSKQSKK